MGVAVDRVDAPFDAELELETSIELPAPSLDHRENSSFLATAGQLGRGKKVRWGSDGAILVEGRASRESFDTATFELRRPRVALYEPWTANIDQGWTQWLLDYYKIPYVLIHNDDFQQANLASRFDTILLARQSASSILHGFRSGEPATGRDPKMPLSLQAKMLQRPEYTGGIGIAGLYHLDSFVREGGTLIALDSATELPIQFFPLSVRNVVRSSVRSSRSDGDAMPRFYCPGSLIRITVDTSHPLAFGMPKETTAFSTGGHAFEISLLPRLNKGEREIRSVARYASSNLLASGWVSGEKAVLDKHILLEARHGQGRVILFGFRPQFRGQSFGTFKFLLNAIYLASAKSL
jgi:hypothetical protein